jgi:hypothetical protein
LRRYRKFQQLLLPTGLIKTVIPIDFAHTGYDDLLIIHSPDLAPPYSASLLRRDGYYFSSLPHNLGLSSLTIPVAFDFDQTGTNDILFQDSASGAFKLFTKNTTFPQMFSITAGQFTGANGIEIIAQTDRTSAQTDVTIFQFRDSEWRPAQTFATPPNSGDLAVGDFDGDGLLDIVFTVNTSSLCFMFNSGRGFYSDPTCTNTSSALHFPLTGIIPDLRPEVGDLTLTGTPDVAIAVRRDGHPVMEVLLNTFCVTCEPRNIEIVPRTHIEGVGPLFDLFDDGRLDFVTDRGAYVSTLATDNHYFLRISALNGHCLDGCAGGERYPDPPPIATTASGAVSRMTFTDSVGNHHWRVAVQPPGLPYAVVGLGEEVHYIDELTVTSTVGEDVWRWLLPNSKVYTSGRGQNRVYLLWSVEPFWILFGTVSLILGLGLVVLLFSRKEEDEDKREAEEILPLF